MEEIECTCGNFVTEQYFCEECDMEYCDFCNCYCDKEA